jgi:hypothetical protein
MTLETAADPTYTQNTASWANLGGRRIRSQTKRIRANAASRANVANVANVLNPFINLGALKTWWSCRFTKKVGQVGQVGPVGTVSLEIKPLGCRANVGRFGPQRLARLAQFGTCGGVK